MIKICGKQIENYIDIYLQYVDGNTKFIVTINIAEINIIVFSQCTTVQYVHVMALPATILPDHCSFGNQVNLPSIQLNDDRLDT